MQVSCGCAAALCPDGVAPGARWGCSASSNMGCLLAFSSPVNHALYAFITLHVVCPSACRRCAVQDDRQAYMRLNHPALLPWLLHLRCLLACLVPTTSTCSPCTQHTPHFKTDAGALLNTSDRRAYVPLNQPTLPPGLLYLGCLLAFSSPVNHAPHVLTTLHIVCLSACRRCAVQYN
jgi:hypothetical protein